VNGNEQIPEEQSSIIVIVSIVCCFSLVLFYWLARPLVQKLQVGWIEFVAYSIIPTSVTFIILYRSNWHQEITGVARTCCLFLLSCVNRCSDCH
jgi:hypothetical protein